MIGSMNEFLRCMKAEEEMREQFVIEHGYTMRADEELRQRVTVLVRRSS